MNIKNYLKYTALALIVFIPIFLAIDYFLNLKINTLKNDKYTTVAQNLKNLTQQLIDDKVYTTLNIAIALSENNSYKRYLLGEKEEALNLREISQKIKDYSNFKNTWIHLIDKNGVSRYRSWTSKKDDNILHARKELIPLLKAPKVTSVISVGIFDLTFKSIVPIYEEEKFIGLIEVITKFNSIAKELEKSGIDLVILVDKRYKQQIKKPFTKLFIDDYYIANLNAKKHLSDIIKKDISRFISLDDYDILEDKLFLTTLKINDFENKPMAYIVLFENYDSIYLDGIRSIEQFIKVIGILITITILALFGAYYYFNKSRYTKTLEAEVKQRTKELDNLIKRYKQIFDDSHVVKLIVDPQTSQVFDANKTALKFYGYSKEKIRQLKSEDINIDLGETKNKEDIYSQIIKNEKNIFIFKHKLANGEIRDVEVYSSSIDIDDKTYIYSIIRDVTEDIKIKKEYEEKQKLFYKQAKMASMGEMLENIAHQWRQPLSTITTAASGIKLRKEFDSLDNQFFEDSLDIVLKSANYLSQTIEDFRNFFKHSNSVEKFHIHIVLHESLNILKLKLQANNINVVIKDNCNDEIHGYKNELIQVFLNILNNCIDAFKQLEQKEKLILINCNRIGKALVVTIQDNANGIDENILEKVFEPYFTTKHKSQGTGIGLYMSEQIVNKHFKGELTAQNNSFIFKGNEYYGASFLIKLPLEMDE